MIRGKIVGLDKIGNEVEHSFVDPELILQAADPLRT